MIWLNGHLLPAGAVSTEDRGFSLGDGLFETILIAGGKPRFLEEHLHRLGQSALRLGIPLPSDIRSGIEELMAATKAEEGVLRLTLSRGITPRGLWPEQKSDPTLLLNFTPQLRQFTPARAILAKERRLAGSALAEMKTLSYLPQILAQKEAIEAKAEEALMLNQQDRLTGAARANLFLVQGSYLVTPKIEDGALPGVTRAKIIELASQKGLILQERSLVLGDLKEASEIFLSNSLYLVRSVTQLGGATWNVGFVAPMMEDLLLAAM